MRPCEDARHRQFWQVQDLACSDPACHEVQDVHSCTMINIIVLFMPVRDDVKVSSAVNKHYIHSTHAEHCCVCLLKPGDMHTFGTDAGSLDLM